MKILYVSEFFPTKDGRFTGGVEARNYFVARGLVKSHKVTVITSRVTKSKSFEKIAGILVHRVGPKRKYSASVGSIFDRIRFTISAIKFAKTAPFDIVDGSNFITHLIAIIIAKSQRVPVVAWYPDIWIGSWLKIAGPLGVLGEILERINIKLGFDAYVTISEIKAKLLRQYVKGPVSVIKCGIDASEFTGSSNKAKEPTILCISRLVPYKHVEDLIWAFALLVKKNQNLKLTIVGRGPEEKKLKNIAIMLKINRKVSFLNNLPRKNLVRTIKSSHIFCLPSAIEGFGISVIEAATAGVPYVVSNIEVFKEVTKNGKGGLFFKLGDISDLAAKLKKLLTDKELYAKKSKESRQLAKIYDWEDIAQKTEKLYLTLIL